MIDINLIDDALMPQTMGLIRAELTSRGWRAEVPYIGSSHCFINRGYGKTIHIFSSSPETSSFVDSSIANDKYAVYQLIKQEKLPQPETLLALDNTPHSDLVTFMEDMGMVVVKPNGGAHGSGITVGVTSGDDLKSAIDKASSQKYSRPGVLLQKQYAHDLFYDLRILCIDYQFIAAVWRVPARVFGDGVHTVEQLIDIENSSSRRGRPYYAPLATIDTASTGKYLGSSMHEVPDVDVEVRVLGIANYGAGGEVIDVTDDIPAWLMEYAEKASKAINLPVIGVDFMAAERPHVSSTMDSLDPVLIEVNKCPSLYMHDAPTVGKNRGVTAKYVDYLATL